jgi:hypothetical protein
MDMICFGVFWSSLFLHSMLIVSSTTEPIRHRIGSVVELTFNKSVVRSVRTVGPAVLACFKLYLSPTSTLPFFTLLAMLTFYVALESITSYHFSGFELGSRIVPLTQVWNHTLDYSSVKC